MASTTRATLDTSFFTLPSAKQPAVAATEKNTPLRLLIMLHLEKPMGRRSMRTQACVGLSQSGPNRGAAVIFTPSNVFSSVSSTLYTP